MKVMLLCGSPNPQGCTYTALGEVAGALESQGIEPVLFQLGAGPMAGCTGCEYCRSTGKGCVIDDGVNKAIEIMKECQGLVIGSPVYFASANGALTAFLDRMFYAGGPHLVHKPGASIVSARRAGTTAALDQLNKYFLYVQMPVISSCYWNMVHGNTPEEVRQDAEGLQIMRTLGSNMAWLLKSIEAAKAVGIVPPPLVKRVATNFIR